MADVDVPVLIVGGGGAGLSASLMLSRLGVPSLLVERHDQTSIHPKAIGLNQRTIEIFRWLGLEQEIAEAAAPPHTYERTAWYTSLGGPTDAHGRLIGVRDGWGGGRYTPEYVAASPSRYTMLAQIRLEPILRAAAEEQELGDLRFGHELVDLEVADDHATATVRVVATGDTLQVRATHVIAADAGRTVADLVGIGDSGQRDLLDMVSAHVRTDLTPHVPDPGVLINWFVDPERGGSIGSGYLYHVGPYDDMGASEEWVFACAFAANDPDRFDTENMPERIRTSLGLPDLDLDVLSVSHWYIQAVVADTFRHGPVFLVGDAAHRIPPWGALGLNTAVQDVHNLAWKVAMVHHGTAEPQLLDSYVAEREPIARSVAARSLENFTNHAGVVDVAVGIAPGMPPAEGRRVVGELFEDSDVGEEKRDAVQAALDALDLEFYAHHAEIGFAYDDGAVVSDGSPAEVPPDQMLTYVPSTRPGHHLPHAWVRRDDGRCSTLDLVAADGFTLLVGDDADAWDGAAAAASERTGVPVAVVRIADDGDATDLTGAWADRCGIDAGGAILVRPDWHVAWRARQAPDDAAGALADVVSRLATAGNDD